MNTAIRKRTESPARWLKAAERAVAEGIDVRQCAGSGLWIATSGTNDGAAYELEVYGNVAIGCSCLAGMNDDGCCKHRAAYYLVLGAIALNPEPPTPAAPADPVACVRCSGTGREWISRWNRRGTTSGTWECCLACGGKGKVAA